MLASIFGHIRLRVLDSPPPSVRMCLRQATADEAGIEADVVTLEALAGHWQQPTL